MYKSEETTKEFGLIEKDNRGDFIKVTRIIPNDQTKLESVDIRQWYTDKGTGELKPTAKGVRFNSEAIPSVVKALLDALSVEELEDLQEAGYFITESENV